MAKPRKNSKDLITLPRATAAAMLNRIRMQYEALDAQRLRRQPEIRTDKSVTEQFFRDYDRIKTYWLGDFIYDNDTMGAAVDTAVRLTVGPRGGRPFFLGADATAWQGLWDSWARHCGYVEGEAWAEMLSQILRAVKIHGDCLILIDPDLTDNKLRVWDADQICKVSTSDFDRWGAALGLPTSGDWCWRQVEGAVVSPTGRVAGYFVTGERNRAAVQMDDATFLPVSLCRRVGARTKISQYRGEPPILATCDLSNDSRSLVKAEVAAAKNFSENALIFERPGTGDGTLSAKLDALTAGAGDGEALDTALIEAAGLDPSDVKTTLKALAGGPEDLKALEGRSAIGFVDHGTVPHELSNANRPAQSIQQWLDALAVINGHRLGIMSCLARGRADNSYSSGMIELAISWAKFEEDQKMLERQVVDYAVERICPRADYLVQWPKCFEIDPEKAEKTRDAQLKGGRLSFQEQLGPNWRNVIDDLAEFTAYCKDKGVDPNVFAWFGETAAGNAKPTETPDEKREDDLK